jgi:hypothetical protein
MNKLEAVEEAKRVLAGAMDWSILRWLAEKRRIREIADRGTASLDAEERRIKAQWPQELTDAYSALCPPSEDDPYAAAEFEFVRQQAQTIPNEIREAAARVRQADEVATRARLDAEQTFDDAERRMSSSLARKGAELAIAAYDVRYQALAEAERANAG